MAFSAEQLIDVGRGVTLCAERWGAPGDGGGAPLLLIAGLGQQLVGWPEGFCQTLADRGLPPIRYDNRDTGRSTHSRFRPPGRVQLLTRRFDERQYSLDDMAADAAGLIDALGLAPVHAVGISMGGMIAQLLAALHPDHVRSLTSIMSSTGARSVGWPAPGTLRRMFRPAPRSREEAEERALGMWRHIGSHGFAFDEAAVREVAARGWGRDPKAITGSGRQLGAILRSGDRTERLRQITAPTLVIHGDRDRMVHPSGGRATARAIPGARLETIPGLGHDLPAGAWDRLADLIAEHAAAADRLRGETADSHAGAAA